MDLTRLRAFATDVYARYRNLILALAGVVLLGGTIVIVGDVQTPGGGHQTITITVRGSGGQPITITAPKTAVQQATATDVGRHQDLRTEAPAGVPGQQLDAGRAQQEQLAATDQLPIVTPDAAPVQAGCVSRFVQNYSSRRGVRPRLFVLHYTVSPNRSGWSDVNAITSLFDTPSFQASSNYVVDNEGHCAYIVRESDKAWTQAGFNSVAVSVEQINTGSEPSYAGTAGLAKLARIISDSTARWHIPLRRGAVSGCTVTRAGIVDHNTLGACGGGHDDITPFAVDQVIAAARAYRERTSITAVDRRTCRKLNWWRAHGRPHGKPEQNAIRRRKALAARGVTCTPKGPVRA